MALNIIPANVNKSTRGEVKRLIKSSFPIIEQFPFWLLSLLALQKGVRFDAYYDNEVFCGLTYTVEDKNMVFILYLAVNDKIRSQGYGSQILQSVKNHVYTKPIVLNVEATNPNAANAQQREKRIEFYRKNGIIDTNYVFVDNGETYSVLSSDSVNFQVYEYKKLLSRFSFGTYRKHIFLR